MPEPNLIRVQAAANVLGLSVGQQGDFAPDYPELAACIERGYVLRVGDDGSVELPPLPPRRGCCGGG